MDDLQKLLDAATPGPWGTETLRTSCGVCHKIGPWPHKWRHGQYMSACIYDDFPAPPEGTDTMLANARLIAMAPDLARRVIAAEKLAEALKRTRDELLSVYHSEFDGVWTDADFSKCTAPADLAIAEWEASK